MRNYLQDLSMSIRSLGIAKVIGIAAIVLVVVGLPISIIALKTQQNLQQEAWATIQSVTPVCNQGEVYLKASFKNNSTNSSSYYWMKVTVKDNQTGKSVDMGTIKSQETKIATIDTGKSSVSSGYVTFFKTWYNHSGSENKIVYYSKLVCKTQYPTYTPSPRYTHTPTPRYTLTPTLTPRYGSTNTPTPAYTHTPTPTYSPTPTYTPTVTPTHTPTPTYAMTNTLTPTPTACPTPEKVLNVKITCPNCTYQQ